MKITVKGKVLESNFETKTSKSGKDYRQGFFTLCTSITPKGEKERDKEIKHGFGKINVFGEALAYNVENAKENEEVETTLSFSIGDYDGKKYTRIDLIEIKRSGESLSSNADDEDFGTYLENEAQKKQDSLPKQEKKKDNEENLPF